MPELVAPMKAMRELTVADGSRTYRGRDGHFSVEKPEHVRQLRQLGCTAPLVAMVPGQTEPCRCGGRKFPDQVVCGLCYREERNA
jgi:hypothetical protein